MRAAISSAGLPSDTHQLVEACIARVRSGADLDDEAVLPPLPKLARRRERVVFTKSQTGVAAAVAVLPARVSTPAPPLRPTSAPGCGRRPWPIFVCAFVAGVASGASFVVSPVGHRPAVQQVTRAARTQSTGVVNTALAWLSSRR